MQRHRAVVGQFHGIIEGLEKSEVEAGHGKATESATLAGDAPGHQNRPVVVIDFEGQAELHSLDRAAAQALHHFLPRRQKGSRSRRRLGRGACDHLTIRIEHLDPGDLPESLDTAGQPFAQRHAEVRPGLHRAALLLGEIAQDEIDPLDRPAGLLNKEHVDPVEVGARTLDDDAALDDEAMGDGAQDQREHAYSDQPKRSADPRYALLFGPIRRSRHPKYPSKGAGTAPRYKKVLAMIALPAYPYSRNGYNILKLSRKVDRVPGRCIGRPTGWRRTGLLWCIEGSAPGQRPAHRGEISRFGPAHRARP